MWLAKTKLPGCQNPEKIVAGMSRHLQLCCTFYGEGLGTKLFRKFFSWYSKGFLNIKPLRISAFAAATCAEMLAIIGEMELLGMEPGTPKYDSHEAEVIEI